MIVKKEITAEETLTIYKNTLKLLRKIEKTSKDFRTYKESIEQYINIKLTHLVTEKGYWGIGDAIGRCHEKIGEYTEIVEKEVKE